MQFDHVAQQVPDIAAALEWWSELIAGARVLYADDTWGLLEAGGAKIAFVMADQHPNHLAFRVSGEELSRMAAQHRVEISGHRDGSRSFYLDAPGGCGVEVIAYPDLVEEDVE
ncbi:MAG TPA: VOC family protein [Solirubrobacteraceae bacterium]|nr:VOC family protein [Solirubrobacteraceae bacterium]